MPAYRNLWQLLTQSGRTDEAAEVQNQAQNLSHSDAPP
jgi:hypothetical protein